jgi:pimeloyl-ACP methyl ester carboxylesterase
MVTQAPANMVNVPGRFVCVGGRSTHLLDVGAGPSVVLETGAGGAAAAWLPVMRLLQEKVRVVAVDRPGAGWSDPGPELLPTDVASRLRATLAAADVPPPYVLVGHSVGAFHVRAFAAAHPDITAGMILVDPSHEEMGTILGRGPRWERMAEAMLMAALLGTAIVRPPGARRVVEGLLAPARIMSLLALDRDQQLLLRRRAALPSAVRATVRERRTVGAACRVIAALDEAGEFPVEVISAAGFDQGGSRQEAREAINELHAELASRWPRGRHRVVAATTHLLPIEHPEVVAAAVEGLTSTTPDALTSR